MKSFSLSPPMFRFACAKKMAAMSFHNTSVFNWGFLKPPPRMSLISLSPPIFRFACAKKMAAMRAREVQGSLWTYLRVLSESEKIFVNIISENFTWERCVSLRKYIFKHYFWTFYLRALGEWEYLSEKISQIFQVFKILKNI